MSLFERYRDPSRRTVNPSDEPIEEASPRASRMKGERGIALILVMGMLVMMTSFVIEFQYSTQVRYSLAANHRDQVRAKHLAVSGINLYRLLVNAVYSASRNEFVASMLSNTGLDINILLTQLVPQLDTSLLRFMNQGFAAQDITLDKEEGASVDAEAEAKFNAGQSGDSFSGKGQIKSGLAAEGAGFLDFDGNFSAYIESEDRKININMLKTDPLEENPAYIALMGLMGDPSYTPLFRERNITPRELIGNLKDWIDADGQVSAGQGGYEDNAYNRLVDPFEAKNTRFTTLSEVHLVQGWDDVFYDLFTPQMTVYGGDKINPNTVSSELLAGMIRAYCTNGSRYQLDQITALLQTSEQWLLLKASVQFSNGAEFSAQLSAAVPGLGDCSGMSEHIGVDTRAWRVVSTGIAGDVQKTIEVVLTSQSSPLYWREN